VHDGRVHVTGERVALNPLTEAMAGRILASERAEDWAAGFPTDGDVRIARVVLAHGIDTSHPYGPYTITERHAGLLIGGVGFKGPPDPAGEVEIGYGVAEEWRGQGLTTEAARLLVAMALADPAVWAVTARTDPGNAASARVLAKLGFARLPTPPGEVDLLFEIRR
jgi:RimJ/RimL family protein N-acetyltransferase